MGAWEAARDTGTSPTVPQRISQTLRPRTPRMLLAMRALNPLLSLASTVALVGCGGGGGGGTPLVNPAKLLVSGASLAAGQTEGEIEIGIASDGGGPTLVQLDLRADPERIRLLPNPTPLQGEARSGPIGPGRYRLVLGDARTAREPNARGTGVVARVPFEVVPGTGPAVVEVFAEAALAADATGKPTPIDAPGAPARIELR